MDEPVRSRLRPATYRGLTRPNPVTASRKPTKAPAGRHETAGPGGDALDVGPAAGKGVGEEGAGEVLSPGCEGFHKVHVRDLGRDVHGRGVPSGDV